MQRRRSPSSASRRAGVSSCSVANSAYPVPDCLASYIARSARRSRSPTLFAVQRRERDADARSHVDGLAVDDECRLERLLELPDDRRRACHVDASPSRIPNSSPPSRATVSHSRRQPTIRSVTSLRSASPCWCPSVSLTCLNSSRSRSRSARESPDPQRRLDRERDAVAEEHAVGQAGEVVVQRLVLERLHVGLALGDVAQAADVDRAAAELHIAQVELHRERGAVPAAADRLGRASAPAGRQELPLGFGVAREVPRLLGTDHHRERLADRLLLAVAEHLGRCAIERSDDSVVADRDDAVRHVVEHRTRPRLAVAHLADGPSPARAT